MNRFPEKYEKPKLFSLDEGLITGWSAICNEGASVTTAAGCSQGPGPTHKGNFIDPEILRQGL